MNKIMPMILQNFRAERMFDAAFLIRTRKKGKVTYFTGNHPDI